MSSQGNQPLPSKEANLFRQVVKFYETKQYKKALKAADQVLKKFPNHGETLAMKGLTLNCMERKDEAYDYVRRGLKADLKSHVCWHVYGLLYRSDREYREAIKCYMNALRLDKENIQILRDLALLQIQMRDIPGFVDTRYQLLQLKPANRNHWISFAVAHHLNKNYEVALEVLEAYESTMEEVPSSEAYEHSELLLYKGKILEEGGQYGEALSLLERCRDKIRDRLSLQELQAGLLLKTGELGKAEELYRKLLNYSPDNYRTHEGLQLCLGLRPEVGKDYTPEQRVGLRELYRQLAVNHPTSTAIRRIPLDFEEGDEFREAVARYVVPYLKRGIPSLFSDLKGLYKNAAKAKLLGQQFQSYLSLLREGKPLPDTDGASNGDAAVESNPSLDASERDSSTIDSNGHEASSSGNDGPPSTSSELTNWVLLFLAQHHSILGDTRRALECIDEALSALPDSIDLHTAKSRILKRAGDYEGAAYHAERARKLDLADRYLNSMAVKALFQAGYIEQAEKTATLFTRDGDQANNLFDMQHMWYEIHCGRAHYKKQQYGPALKKFLAVGKHFEDFREDQFDFHGYCIRKMTLRAYVNMLRMEDQLFSHPFYHRATCAAIQCYLDLDAQPSAAQQAADEEALLASMTAEERKAYKLKKKKEEKKKKEAEEKELRERQQREKEQQKAQDANKRKGTSGGPAKEKDPDPDGAKLAATTEPLGEAAKLVEQLKAHGGDRLETHIKSFEVASRRGKLLQALSAVQRAVQLAGHSHPDAHCLVVRFSLLAEKQKPEHTVVETLVNGAAQQLLGALNVSNVVEYANAYLNEYGNTSLAHRAAAAEMLALVDNSQVKRAVQLVVNGDVQPCPLAASASLDDCIRVHLLLRDTLKDEKAAERWQQQCADTFSWSGYFEGPARTSVGMEEANGTAAALERLALEAKKC